MESQTNELATSRLPTLQLPVAYRLPVGCFVAGCSNGITDPLLILHSLVPPLSLAVPIRPHYVSIPTAITACSPFLPRRRHPCSSQQSIRFQDATEILLLLIYPVTLASFAKLTLTSEPGRY